MIELRPILLIIGILLSTLGCTMMLPAIYDLANGNDEWMVFVAAAVFTLFAGGALAFSNRGASGELSIKQAFVLTTFSWIFITAFSALPFVWSSEVKVSYTDAFFEAMSGVTTTGATVLTGLDDMPPGIKLWRALLQWMGGIGIIVMAIAVFPMLRIGGMQLFRMESSDTSEKILPRATQIAGSISLLYLGLTLACVFGYLVAGMGIFDAVAHAMTTIATGGFSTYDSSMGKFDDPTIEFVAVVFMILGSLPFVVMLQALNGQVSRFFVDVQVRWFFGLLVFFVFSAWLSQSGGGHQVGILEFRDATFNVVSIMTGTGYTTQPFDTWSPFATTLFMMMMFVGGCAGSTSCGIKVFRFHVVYATVRQRVLTFVQPHRVVAAYFNGKPMTESVTRAVMNFVFLFLVSFGVIAYLLSLYDLDAVTALSASASALANVGPGLGPVVGPIETYKSLPDGAKWILCAAMLLGRLELFSVFVLLTPAFWRS